MLKSAGRFFYYGTLYKGIITQIGRGWEKAMRTGIELTSRCALDERMKRIFITVGMMAIQRVGNNKKYIDTKP